MTARFDHGAAHSAMCAGKEPLTARRAREILARQNRTREKRRIAYRCPFCRAWHIGMPPPKALRK